MCGFSGLINFDETHDISPNKLKDMNNSIVHRGPDESSYFIKRNIGLGFNRLSIIDLESGNQPMSDISRSIWIVFNGEIYNYKELKNDLIKLGHKFKTNSDTEVVINSYIEYKEKCVEFLRGMFAFVLWDSITNKVFMARDRFGIKPLYYLIHKDGIVFASELKAIYKSGFSNREIDLTAVDSFFTYGYILSPHSIYTDIKKLPAAHTLSIPLRDSKINVSVTKYWEPVFHADYSFSYQDYKYQLRERLEETIEKHLVSDVSIGAFLSGGIDSNSIVSIMSKLYGGKLKTFTIGFRESKFDESKLAKITSKKYGTDHHEIILSQESPLQLEQMINMYDEPFGDSSCIPTYFVSNFASEHVKVVLSGDGGDEFFGGYNSYLRLKRMQEWKLPSFIQQPVFRTLSKVLPKQLPGKRFAYTMAQQPEYYYAYFNHLWYDEKLSFYNENILSTIKNQPVQKIKMDYIDASKSDDYLSSMMELDILTYMTDDILTKVDRASMANSLEVRVPIIDHSFFELAAKIPSDYKVKSKSGKHIFREAMKDLLPEEVYTFPKSGFSIPINEWFKHDLNEFVHDSINSGNQISQFIQKPYLFQLHNTRNLGSMITRIWPIIVFNTWLNNVHSE